jgi:hypothetical protein
MPYPVIYFGEEAGVIGYAETVAEAEEVFARHVHVTTGKREMPPVLKLKQNKLGQRYFEPAE